VISNTNTGGIKAIFELKRLPTASHTSYVTPASSILSTEKHPISKYNTQNKAHHIQPNIYINSEQQIC
jgi:hypothetical protein